MCLFAISTGLVRASIMHIHPGMNSESLPGGISAVTDLQEQRFQEYLNNVISEEETIDTAGWCTYKINCNKFDYRQLTDTLRLQLVDSAKGHFFTYPLKNYVTSPFGVRRQFWHLGTDIKVNYRDTIHCAFDGIVRIVTNDRYGYGKVVVVRHRFGFETLYAHLAATMVKNNQELKSGDVIGLGGRTGRATGNHLHFEVRFCGEPFDPGYLLDLENYTLKSPVFALSRSVFEYIGEVQKTLVYTVQSGDNLGRIAHSYCTSISKICSLNNITPRTLLKIGRKLVVRKMDTPEQITEGGAGPVPGS
jgi:hypothetical protein